MLSFLDHSPVRPSIPDLGADNSCIQTMFLPLNTPEPIQLMNQGIIVATKRLCWQSFLDEVTVVYENEDERHQGMDM